MTNQWQWQQGVARVFLLVDGENSERFFSYVKAKLTNDCYNSLVEIRNYIKAEEGLGVLSFSLCLVVDHKVYALAGGEGSLALVRGGKHTYIIKAGKAMLVSGNILDSDELVLKTRDHSYTYSNQETAEVIAPKKAAIKQRAVGVIDRLLSKIPERRIVIHEPGGGSPRPKKTTLIGIGLLVLLGISIYFGIARQKDNLRREEYEPALLEAMRNLEEAKEVVGLSDTRARELILASRETAKALADEGVKDERLDSLLLGISENLGQIAGIYDTPAELFLDLGIVASGFEGNDLAYSGGTIRVLDSKNRRLVGVEVANKRTDLISGSDYLPDALSTAAYADRSFILSRDGIREVTGEVELVVKTDWDPSQVFITAFAGNLYVFDKQNNQIWRHQGVSGGFLEKEPWLGEGFTIDLASAVSWSIDGSIWTIDQSGNFKVYSVGAPATFAVRGASTPFENVVNLFVSDESKFVYVLDSGASRISVIDKNGQYVGEYVANEISGATDLAVDEESGKIIFLANSKLYWLSANHLNDNTNNE